MESLENQNRCKNIRIDVIPEEANETWVDIQRKVKMALESRLNFLFEMEIERAHRTWKGDRRSSDDNAWATCPAFGYLSLGELEAKGSDFEGCTRLRSRMERLST